MQDRKAANRLQDIWVWNGRPNWDDVFREMHEARQHSGTTILLLLMQSLWRMICLLQILLVAMCAFCYTTIAAHRDCYSCDGHTTTITLFAYDLGPLTHDFNSPVLQILAFVFVAHQSLAQTCRPCAKSTATSRTNACSLCIKRIFELRDLWTVAPAYEYAGGET